MKGGFSMLTDPLPPGPSSYVQKTAAAGHAAIALVVQQPGP